MFAGLEEEGLYRISGANSEIQRLKKTFDKSDKSELFFEQVDLSSAL